MCCLFLVWELPKQMQQNVQVLVYDCGSGNGFMGSAWGETRGELLEILEEMIDINCGAV